MHSLNYLALTLSSFAILFHSCAPETTTSTSQGRTSTDTLINFTGSALGEDDSADGYLENNSSGEPSGQRPDTIVFDHEEQLISAGRGLLKEEERSIKLTVTLSDKQKNKTALTTAQRQVLNDIVIKWVRASKNAISAEAEKIVAAYNDMASEKKPKKTELEKAVKTLNKTLKMIKTTRPAQEKLIWTQIKAYMWAQKVKNKNICCLKKPIVEIEYEMNDFQIDPDLMEDIDFNSSNKNEFLDNITESSAKLPSLLELDKNENQARTQFIDSIKKVVALLATQDAPSEPELRLRDARNFINSDSNGKEFQERYEKYTGIVDSALILIHDITGPLYANQVTEFSKNKKVQTQKSAVEWKVTTAIMILESFKTNFVYNTGKFSAWFKEDFIPLYAEYVDGLISGPSFAGKMREALGDPQPYITPDGRLSSVYQFEKRDHYNIPSVVTTLSTTFKKIKRYIQESEQIEKGNRGADSGDAKEEEEENNN